MTISRLMACFLASAIVFVGALRASNCREDAPAADGLTDQAQNPDGDSTEPGTAPGMDVVDPPARRVELVEDPRFVPDKPEQGEHFPGIRLDLKNGLITVRGYLSLQRGVLEYLASTPRGSTYESLLVFQCLPEHLNLCLIALGLKPRPQVSEQGEVIALRGDRVCVDISWVEDGKTVKKRVEEVIYDFTRDAAMPMVGWVYTGGRLVDDPAALFEEDEQKKKQYGKVFSANLTGNIAATFHEPNCLLDTPLIEGGNDEAFYAWYEKLPPRFTKLTIEIHLPKEGELLPLPELVKPGADSTELETGPDGRRE